MLTLDGGTKHTRREKPGLIRDTSKESMLDESGNWSLWETGWDDTNGWGNFPERTRTCRTGIDLLVERECLETPLWSLQLVRWATDRRHQCRMLERRAKCVVWPSTSPRGTSRGDVVIVWVDSLRYSLLEFSVVSFLEVHRPQGAALVRRFPWGVSFPEIHTPSLWELQYKRDNYSSICSVTPPGKNQSTFLVIGGNWSFFCIQTMK